MPGPPSLKFHGLPPPPPPPLVDKEEEKNRTRAHQTKLVGVGLEDFVDWMGIISSEPVEEEEMSSLAAGFSVQMRKRVAGLEGETTPIYSGKRLRWSSPDEEAQKV